VNVFIPVGVAALAAALYTWFHPGLTGKKTDRSGLDDHYHTTPHA
jgi:hypothetical protein